MAWKTPEVGEAIKLKEQKIGQEWVGIYTNKRDVKTKKGQAVIWEFMDENEKPFEIWGCGSLDHKMKNIAIKSLVKIKFVGTYTTKFGQEGANVEVQYDDGE